MPDDTPRIEGPCRANDRHAHCHDIQTGNRTLAKDPVCGMTVDPHTAQHRTLHEGHPYYFCSAGCKAKFEAAPAQYLKDRAPPPVLKGATYTCPMRPEIRQPDPGFCPIAAWHWNRKPSAPIARQF